MINGALIYPGEENDLFIAKLQTIRYVKWRTVLTSGKLQEMGDRHDLLPSNCNMVTVLDPDYTSFSYLSGLIRKGCHLFLTEKQKMTSEERAQLIELAEEGNTLIQIRNDLLFHPSLSINSKIESASKLIEIHHSEPGKAAALQEMLYSNLLMILRIVDSEPARISVCSIPNSGYQPDVVNLHLNFHNGSAASLTLSFTGEKKEHLLSVHSPKGVKHYTFNEKLNINAEVIPGFEKSQLYSTELLFKQITNFAECIVRKSYHKFGLSDESRTFLLMEKINRKLEFSLA